MQKIGNGYKYFTRIGWRKRERTGECLRNEEQVLVFYWNSWAPFARHPTFSNDVHADNLALPYHIPTHTQYPHLVDLLVISFWWLTPKIECPFSKWNYFVLLHYFNAITFGIERLAFRQSFPFQTQILISNAPKIPITGAIIWPNEFCCMRKLLLLLFCKIICNETPRMFWLTKKICICITIWPNPFTVYNKTQWCVQWMC